ncbi:MAG: flagellar motor switch protein FliN/FliY [Cognaticolwellia sp.]|jgi:flagellar motor switch protein FliN/FliY
MPKDVTFLHDIPVDVVVELGRARLTIRELAELGNDEILELDRPADQPLDLVVGGRVYARGEVVMVGERLAIRITSILGGEIEGSDEEQDNAQEVTPMKESA